MTGLPRLCPTCPAVIPAGTARCRECERERNRSPKRRAYADPAYRAIPLGGTCWICGEPGADTRDHVLPLEHGGTNDPANIRPAHRSCNSRRGARV